MNSLQKKKMKKKICTIIISAICAVNTIIPVSAADVCQSYIHHENTSVSDIQLYDSSGTLLEQGVDYDLYYTNNIDVGTGMVTVKFKGNYEGEMQIPFEIVNAEDIKGCYMQANDWEISYDPISNQTEYGVDVSLGNNSEENKRCMFAMAIYNEDDTLEGMSIEHYTLEANSLNNYFISSTINEIKNGGYIKIFLWDEKTAEPLTESVIHHFKRNDIIERMVLNE